MAFYESIFIVRSDMTSEQVDVVVERVLGIIKDEGGKVIRSENWGRRQLAYQVKKQNQGYYFYNVLDGEGMFVRNTEARMKIDEDVLKFMSVRVPKPTLSATPLAPSEDRGDRGGPRDGGGRGDRGPRDGGGRGAPPPRRAAEGDSAPAAAAAPAAAEAAPEAKAAE